ncbi:nucleotidyltransferase domain-containing protein [Stackebrandtia nassauensis]|uniref:Polymerase nucleotidyl transferase domain-containing protein n=1 Tax=Stackebrandtia nassauensis (strain DSM 44728 / CIP 108903 / NRRL B-16338 / NBRC 102104 / LLR-40K-21) TaxID=446470 RepID=D3QB23_STANL|nr:nucleotidyltransferase domain-containing protein [Stackebrandtia nassauensis]ADD40840.1 hypothetical protein Snas_1130 [Stackebrandtia nassauensis DSM 44728]
MKYPALIDRLTAAFSAEPRVLGVFLIGSRGRGTADDHSDVDLLLCAEPEHHTGLCDDMPQLVAEATETVHSQRVGTLPVFTYIAAGWLRFDISVASPAELMLRAPENLTVLFDRTSLTETITGTPVPVEPDAATVEAMTREFLRVLGLLPVVLGRGEHALGVAGFGLLHGMLVQALRLTARVVDPGGVLSLKHLIPEDVYQRLEEIPAVEAEPASLIDAHLACARLFLPTAHRLHEKTGADWPTAMAEALETHLRKTVDERFAALTTWR